MKKLYIGITKLVDGERKSKTLVVSGDNLRSDLMIGHHIKTVMPGWTVTGWRERETDS
jgi:hypothetical protein